MSSFEQTANSTNNRTYIYVTFGLLVLVISVAKFIEDLKGKKHRAIHALFAARKLIGGAQMT